MKGRGHLSPPTVISSDSGRCSLHSDLDTARGHSHDTAAVPLAVRNPVRGAGSKVALVVDHNGPNWGGRAAYRGTDTFELGQMKLHRLWHRALVD